MTKRLVVSDSSSLILTTKAGLLDTLCREFSIEIPRKVFEETVIPGKMLQRVDAFKIEQARKNKKIHVKKVKYRGDKGSRQWSDLFNLDEGERQALYLYLQSSADLLLTDDRQAINTAKLLEINWATAPDLVIGFAERRKIKKEKARYALQTLQEEGRYKLGIILEAFRKIEKIKGGKT